MKLSEQYDLAKLETSRRLLGLSKAALARRSLVSLRTVMNVLELGNGSEETVLKMANALGMPMAMIVKPAEFPERKSA